jgi:hypothetical protein
MCFNKEVSLLAFIVALIIACKLLINETSGSEQRSYDDDSKKMAGLYLLFLALMQFLEFFMWIFLKNKSMNKIISYLIPIVIFFQALSMYIGGLTLDLGLNKSEKISSTVFMIIFGLITFYILMNHSKLTTINNSCKLKWNIMNNSGSAATLYFFAYIIVILINCYHAYKGPELVGIVIGCFALSMIYGKLMGDQNSLANNGSLWCFAAVIVSMFYFIAL